MSLTDVSRLNPNTRGMYQPAPAVDHLIPDFTTQTLTLTQTRESTTRHSVPMHARREAVTDWLVPSAGRAEPVFGTHTAPVVCGTSGCTAESCTGRR